MSMVNEAKLTLVSHNLCPYVQRAVIALSEKGVPFERIDVDLAQKPDWFRAISPLGKVPLLRIGDAVIFESAVILEYLEETQPRPLHSENPITRAEHRSWIEFCSSILNDIWSFYVAPDKAAFDEKAAVLKEKFGRVEAKLGEALWFAGDRFGLVDAAFGPVFRYFDALDRIGDFGILADLPKVSAWRRQLAERPSIQSAVSPDYAANLWRFLLARRSHLSHLMAGKVAPSESVLAA